jgi:hypothetical protein
MVVYLEWQLFVRYQSEFCVAGSKYPTEKCRNRHRKSEDIDLREKISKAIKSKHLVVRKDP